MDVKTACRNPQELSELAQEALTLFLLECRKQGLNVLVTETYRSQERQNYLYEQGRSRPGNKVTWTLNSRHTSRRAWDICKNVKGEEYSDTVFFSKCGAIAKELGITWGGTWQQADTPHFEIDTTWKAPKKADETLVKAVNSIIDSGVSINATSWNSVDKINLKNVPALLDKLGGVVDLGQRGVIGEPLTWLNHKYSKENVRSLLIKYASKL